MQLTSFTDIALRIVMRLSVSELARTVELAEDLQVNYAHATKVVTALQKLGLIETRRGRNGGIRLIDGAQHRTIGSIVRALETGEVVECEGANPCPLRGGCGLRAALREAQEAFFSVLDELTIADATTAPTKQLLLGIGRP